MSEHTWRTYHSLRHHVLVPLWSRVPEGSRWRVVHLLNQSQRFGWCSLVDAAMNPADGDDACDGHLPLPEGKPPACAVKCDWMHDHSEGGCACYCGKFKFASEATR